ncbi:protease inhibitor I42 family protein [Rhodococcus phenolicus]|uniref:protease inhibitor I42 family protein n=1 Tax=Rhodococcus phenolicus TaxID=263849 RepID=UPI000834E464|nr:protease inhibitor I42 family protein [Rhodococcus phenolicus]
MKHVVTSDARDVTVAAGDIVELHLMERSTSGSTWFTDRIGDGLVWTNLRYLPSNNPLPGGGAERIMTLRAKRAGSWPVSLRLRPGRHATVNEYELLVKVT